MTALVCGATGGLGTAVVAAFTARGEQVVGVSRTAPAEALSPGVIARQADLGSREAVDQLWDELLEEGLRPDWVVNVAGGFLPGSVAEGEPETFQAMLDLNLATAWWSCRAAAQHLAEGGAIVNVSSRAALSGGAGSAAYAVAKAGVVRLTEVLAAELRPRRVRVNAVLPTLIDTPSNRAHMSPEAMRNAVPPERIAATIAWLCSPEAEAVSGAVITV